MRRSRKRRTRRQFGWMMLILGAMIAFLLSHNPEQVENRLSRLLKRDRHIQSYQPATMGLNPALKPNH